MRRVLSLALAAAAALAAGGCSTSPCQRLGEKLCGCTATPPDVCTTQVEDRLNALKPSADTEDTCRKYLDTCNAPEGADFCEWLNTTDGKTLCGLTPEVVTTVVP